RKELQSLIEGGQVNLAIDLADVGIIDSKGLAVFMMCHKSVSSRGGKLTVLTTNEDFKHLFHVMRLDEHFTVAESL
ncbi:MAG: STAS domain-containing protein, partial [Actinomycetia bacterium]|nr:STAS domain-containing protein [Actinomycetes bacterium]